jgi:hypothetical protein
MGHPRTSIFKRKRRNSPRKVKPPRKPRQVPEGLKAVGRVAVDLAGTVVGAKFGGPAGAKLARAVISGARNRLKPVSNNMNKVHGYKTIITAIVAVIGIFLPGVPEWVSAHPKETMILGGFAMILLRIFTKGAIGQGMGFEQIVEMLGNDSPPAAASAIELDEDPRDV